MTNAEKYEYFWDQVVPLLLKRLKHVTLCRSGSIFYGNFKDRVFCATPFWDGTDGIDCQWMTEDGKGLRGDTIPYEVTGDPELDYCAYYRAVENYLEAGQSNSLTPTDLV
jgi:hypothetical protein